MPGKLLLHISYQKRKRTPHKSNGFSVLIVSLILYITGIYYKYFQINWAYLYFWELFTIVNALAFLFSIFIYFQKSISVNDKGSNFNQFWSGTQSSPKFIGSLFASRLELKRVSYIFLMFIAVSLGSQQYYREVFELLKPGPPLFAGVPLFLYLFLLFIWVLDKIYFEQQETFTEGFNAPVGWGVVWWHFCAVPFFYCVPIFSLLIESYESISPFIIVCILFLYFIGYTLSRGSIQQRFYLNTLGPSAIIWGDRPIVIEYNGSKNTDLNDSKKNRRVLISGWWGIVRYPQYLGESLILFSLLAICLVTHFNYKIAIQFVAAVLIFSYFIVDSEKRNTVKYADIWKHYCICVKSKFFPSNIFRI